LLEGRGLLLQLWRLILLLLRTLLHTPLLLL
jgi:hypothetical protein